jgi:hypothetical protein
MKKKDDDKKASMARGGMAKKKKANMSRGGTAKKTEKKGGDMEKKLKKTQKAKAGASHKA